MRQVWCAMSLTAQSGHLAVAVGWDQTSSRRRGRLRNSSSFNKPALGQKGLSIGSAALALGDRSMWRRISLDPVRP